MIKQAFIIITVTVCFFCSAQSTAEKARLEALKEKARLEAYKEKEKLRDFKKQRQEQLEAESNIARKIVKEARKNYGFQKRKGSTQAVKKEKQPQNELLVETKKPLRTYLLITVTLILAIILLFKNIRNKQEIKLNEYKK